MRCLNMQGHYLWLFASLFVLIHTGFVQNAENTKGDTIPVLDMSSVNLSIKMADLNATDSKRVASYIKEALLEWGFVYLVKHGIPMYQVEETFESSKQFFEQSVDIKEKYTRPAASERRVFGYTGVGREYFKEEKKSYEDIKECFDFGIEPNVTWPKEVPKLKTDVESLYQNMAELASRILYLFGIALELEDPLYFVKTHSRISSGGTGTSFRTLYYPAIGPDVKPGQLRCSEHTDYGSMTLLFQDDIGGLLVKRRDGSFVPATPVKDAVLLNIADLMQRWTSDELMSVRHKVIIPEEETRLRKPRQSMVLFVHPNNDTIVAGIKGTHKYQPINAYEYLWANFRATYNDQELKVDSNVNTCEANKLDESCPKLR